MLSAENNALLTRIGPGTPMGSGAGLSPLLAAHDAAMAGSEAWARADSIT